MIGTIEPRRAGGASATTGVPNGWMDLALQDMVDEVDSGDWGSDSSGIGRLPCRVLRGTDFPRVSSGVLSTVPVRYLKSTSVGKHQLGDGDVLIEISGGSKDQATGRILLIDARTLAASDKPLCFSNFTKRLRVHRSRVYPLFFAFQWDWLYLQGLTRIHEERTTGIRNLRLGEFLKQTRVLLPPLAEQHSIANALLTVRRAREASETLIIATSELRKSLLHHLFRHGIGAVTNEKAPSLKDADIGPVPAHWEVATLKDHAEMFSGGTPSKREEAWWTGPVPWASPKDLKVPRLKDTEDHISVDAAATESRLLPARSLLLVVRGMILAKDVPVALIEVPMAFNQDLKGIVPHPDVAADYLLYACERFKEGLAREIGTSAHGTRRIGTDALERWRLPFPPMEEQLALAKFLSAVDRKLQAEHDRLKALSSLYESMLNRTMTGAGISLGVDLS